MLLASGAAGASGYFVAYTLGRTLLDVYYDYNPNEDQSPAVVNKSEEITKKEGIFAGNSAGSAMAGLMQLKDKLTADDIVVVIFHDHGTRYLGKMFNDDWMKSKGFFDKKGLTAKDLVNTNTGGELVTLETSDTIEKALALMNSLDISQIPVTNDKRIVGSINENKLFEAMVSNPEIKHKNVVLIY